MPTELPPPQEKDPIRTARTVYLLYLGGILIHLLAVIGLITAYAHRNDEPRWLRTHYRYQILTFWIGLLYVIGGMLLSNVPVGYLVFLWWLVWLTIRCVKGLKALGRGEPIPDPETWWF